MRVLLSLRGLLAVAVIAAASLPACTLGPMRAASPGHAAEAANQSQAGSESAVRQKPIHGKIVQPDGRPIAGAAVWLYPSAGPAGGNTPTQAARTTTDASGEFGFDVAPGTYNLEAALSHDAVAFRAAIVTTSGVPLDVGPVALDRPGSIAGRVAANSAVSDLGGIAVYIPGASFTSRTDAAGRFLLSGVPAGTFDLIAEGGELGRAHAHAVSVRPGKATEIPVMILETRGPSIDMVTPPAGGPGVEVTIRGGRFGAASGAPLQVSFNGSPAIAPHRQDDRTIVARVPDGARSGPVLVTVDGVPSNAAAFKVVRTLSLSPAEHYLLVGATRSLEVSGTDTAGSPVSVPELAWRLDSAVATASAGVLAGTAPGTATLAVSSGTIVATASVKVFDGRVDRVSLTPETVTLGAREKASTTVFEAVAHMSDGSTNDLVVLGVSDPASVSLAPDGRATIADTGTNGRVTVMAVSRLDAQKAATAAIAVHNVAMVYTLDDCPSCYGIAADPAGNLVLGAENRLLYRPAIGGPLGTLAGTGERGYRDGPGQQATFAGLAGIAVYPGTVYPVAIADQGNHAIRIAGGSLEAPTVYTLAGGADGSQDGTRTAAQFHCPAHLSPGPDGNFYVADICLPRVRMVDLAGNVTTVAGNGLTGLVDGLAGSAEFRNIGDLSVDASGDIYVADSGNHAIRRIRGGMVETFAGRQAAEEPRDGYRLEARFALPEKVFAAPDGNVYIADNGTGIRVIDRAGFVSTLAGSATALGAHKDGPGPIARFEGIGGFAMDGAGNLYVTDGGKLRMIVP